MLIKTFVVVTTIVLLAGCRFHDWTGADDFAGGLRCGMTKQEIEDLAAQHGASRDSVRQLFSSSVLRVSPKELDFVDVLIEGGGAVAFQRGNYIAFSTGMDFRQIKMLCPGPPIVESTFDEYERNLVKESKRAPSSSEPPSN